MLSDEERISIIEALEEWSEHATDEPVLGFMASEGLKTPREIVREVQEGTSDGQAVLDMIEHGVRRIGLEETLRILRRRPE
jgi:hypothetical protein